MSFSRSKLRGTTTLHPNQPIAVDRQTAFQNVETARLNQVQQALQLVEADAFEDEDEEDYDDEMIPRIYDMNELYGTPCIDSHECKFPVQHTLMDRLMIYLLKSLKMTDHSPFHMTWSEYVLGLGPFEQDSIAIEATRSQLANAFREELVETVLPTQPDRYISINYEVLVDFRDEPLFEVELIPRNVNIGSIAKMMVSTIRCAELVIQGTIPEVEAEIRPIVEL